ncbi:hypothetical protein C8D77_111174 [Mesorhizobium loti]|uniref:Uncharacterized protein n=1 Tax=Rhizobium loti TaxID=381 RepID=A0A8E3B319_RHILI|nr:hypothetical protein C8D77_111174 [Mesorhizobium loti]
MDPRLDAAIAIAMQWSVIAGCIWYLYRKGST